MKELTSLDSIKYWLDAYSNPGSGDHFLGHGVVAQLLGEYHALRKELDEAKKVPFCRAEQIIENESIRNQLGVRADDHLYVRPPIVIDNKEHLKAIDALEDLLKVFKANNETEYKAYDKAKAVFDAQKSITAKESLCRQLTLAELKASDWRPINTAPENELILLASEFDGPGDWRIKCGLFYEGDWHVFGASWEPTMWQPLPDNPAGSVLRGEPTESEF